MKFINVLVLLLFAFSLEGLSQKYLLEQDANKDTIIPKVGYRRKFDFSNYTGIGLAYGPNTKSPISDIQLVKSWQFRQGFWGRMKLTKWYAIGLSAEYARDCYRMKSPLIADTMNNSKTLWTKQVNNNFVIGVFDRINLKGDKLFIDLGAYYALDCLPRVITRIKPANSDFQDKKTIYNRPSFMNRKNYGLDFRVVYGGLSLYGRYRITGLYKNQDYDVPKIMIGVMVDYLD